MGGGVLEKVIFFYYESKFKIKNIFFFLAGEGGGGARVSDYFHKESKS